MGGLGFAFPAGTCSLMMPTTFLAMRLSFRVQAGADSKCGRPPQQKTMTRDWRLVTSPPATPCLCLLYLAEIEFDRGRAPEDRHGHPQLVLVVVDVLDVAVEIREWPFLHAHRLAHLEQHLRARLFHALLDLVQDVLHLLLRYRRGLGRGAAHE